MPTPKSISNFKPLITNLAQTSHYQVIFGLPSSGTLSSYLSARGVNTTFVTESSGLLCSSASIPGSSLGTADINGNFMGVQEKMAHTRIFTQMQLEFYVDSDYRMMKFLEHWMEYIASGSGQNAASTGYYYRMQYPDDYKSNSTKIIKFDRDYAKEFEYNFIGLFPINMSSVPISYDSSEIMKVSVSFNYERYIPGKISSYSSVSGTSNNVQSGSQSSSATTTSQSSNSTGPLGAPTAIGLNSQQTLNEFYQYGLNGGKSAKDFIGPVP